MPDRGGCATVRYRTPATSGHTTKTQSMQLYLIQRNKHGEAARTRRQRNTAQMKEQIKTPEKELNKMEIRNLSDADFQTLVIRMLKELSENLNIKKIQSEMKDTLICRESTIKWMKLRIKSMIWRIRKQKTISQNNKKKESKKKKIKRIV